MLNLKYYIPGRRNSVYRDRKESKFLVGLGNIKKFKQMRTECLLMVTINIYRACHMSKELYCDWFKNTKSPLLK